MNGRELGEVLAKEPDRYRIKIQDAIADLIVRKQFYGYVLNSLRRELNPNLPAALAVAARPGGRIVLQYNPRHMWVNVGDPPQKNLDAEARERTHDELVGGCEHEANHLIMDHIWRFRDRMNQRGAYATDMAINQFTTGLPNYVIRHTMFGFPPNLSADEYYDLLKEDLPEPKCPFHGNGQPEPGADQGDDPGDGGQPGNGSDQPDAGGSSQPGQGAPGHGSPGGHSCGSGCGVPSQDQCPFCTGAGFDDHSQWNVADAEATRQAVKQIVATAAQESKLWQASQGMYPAGMLRAVKDMLKPPVYDGWDQLDDELSGLVRCDRRRNFRRPDRRHPHLPGLTVDRKPRLAMLLDTSGSVTQAMVAVFAANVMRKAETAEVVLLDVDAKVQNVRVLNAGDGIDSVKGNGGTVFEPAFAALAGEPVDLPPEQAELLGDVEMFVILTDGGVSWPEENPLSVPVIVAVPDVCIGKDLDDEAAAKDLNIPAWARFIRLPFDEESLVRHGLRSPALVGAGPASAVPA